MASPPILPLHDAFAAFGRLLPAARRIVLTTHVNPDGDGLGSELALANHFHATGREAWIVNYSPTPAQYRFLDPDGTRLLLYDPPRHNPLLRDADLIIVVDTNHPDRLVSMKEAVLSSPAAKVVIDHHLEPDTFAALYVIDDTTCATGEIIFRLLESLGAAHVTPASATALYTAIMTDTGSFRYPKTDADVHRIVAQLIECGADPSAIFQQVYEQGPAGRLQLLGEVLAGMHIAHGGRVCALQVTQEMLQRTGTTIADTDAFVPYALSIGGVQIGLMFSEVDGAIKVNFRSKGDIRINELAKLFGGNGHMNAAGASVANRRLKDVVTEVLARASEFVR